MNLILSHLAALAFAYIVAKVLLNFAPEETPE